MTIHAYFKTRNASLNRCPSSSWAAVSKARELCSNHPSSASAVSRSTRKRSTQMPVSPCIAALLRAAAKYLDTCRCRPTVQISSAGPHILSHSCTSCSRCRAWCLIHAIVCWSFLPYSKRRSSRVHRQLLIKEESIIRTDLRKKKRFSRKNLTDTSVFSRTSWSLQLPSQKKTIIAPKSNVKSQRQYHRSIWKQNSRQLKSEVFWWIRRIQLLLQAYKNHSKHRRSSAALYSRACWNLIITSRTSLAIRRSFFRSRSSTRAESSCSSKAKQSAVRKRSKTTLKSTTRCWRLWRCPIPNIKDSWSKVMTENARSKKRSTNAALGKTWSDTIKKLYEWP